MIAAVMLFIGLALLAYIATTPGDQYVAGFLGGFLVATAIIQFAIGRLDSQRPS